MALKRWNFPDNLDFNSKIVAKFLRIHFLSVQNNMKINQQIHHGAFHKVPHLHNGIFSFHLPVSLSQFYLITSGVID